MKVKGMSWIELHAEKLLLGVVGLLFLAVLTLQFLGGGNAVRVETQSDVPIDQAFERVADRARTKLNQLRDEDPDQRIPAEHIRVSALLERALVSPIVTSDRLAAQLGINRFGSDADAFAPGSGDDLIVAEIVPPRTSAPLVRAFSGTLDPGVVLAHDELTTYVRDEQPFDFRAVTVEATFDARELRRRLETDPDGSGPAQEVPRYFWQNRLEILKVEIERQERLPDGQWGSIETIPAMPGRASFDDRLRDELPPRELQRIVDDSRNAARDVRQPRFYAMIAGEEWIPPSFEVRQQRAEPGDVAILRRQLDSLRSEIARLREELGRTGRSSNPVAAPDRYVAQGLSPGSGGGARSAPRERSATQQDRGDRDRLRRENLENRLEALQARETRLVDRLRALGIDTDEQASTNPVAELLAREVRSLREADEVTLWAHDIGVRPGATYRYRTRVVMPNPLYAQTQVLHESVHDLARSPVVMSPPSEWSQPVSVDAETYWFVARAGDGREAAIGSNISWAQVEVYGYYYGAWRREQVRLYPGDRVALDYPLAQLELPLYEISEDGTVRAAARGQDQPRLDGVIEIDTGHILLDVVPASVRYDDGSMARDAIVFQVVSRGPDGVLRMRTAFEDRTDELRRRLSADADRGELAVIGRPGEGPAVRPAAPTERDRPDRDQPYDRSPDVGDRPAGLPGGG